MTQTKLCSLIKHDDVARRTKEQPASGDVTVHPVLSVKLLTFTFAERIKIGGWWLKRKFVRQIGSKGAALIILFKREHTERPAQSSDREVQSLFLCLFTTLH